MRSLIKGIISWNSEKRWRPINNARRSNPVQRLPKSSNAASNLGHRRSESIYLTPDTHDYTPIDKKGRSDYIKSIVDKKKEVDYTEEGVIFLSNSNQVWIVDADHSSAEFSIRHLMISTVRGRFGKLSGTVMGDPSDLSQGSAELTIDVSSVDTHQPDRDNHLRSADFFDVEHFPAMTFKSKEIRSTGKDRYDVIGDLTIRGTTRPITVKVEALGTNQDPWGGTRAGFSAEARLNRKDYGLTWNQVLETGGVMVGDEVRIAVELETVLETGK